jgi:hypothetical protein
MKSARVNLWNAQPSQNPKAPILNGAVELPAQLIWELSQAMQQGQGLETNQQTGEQFFKLRLSVWRGTGENNAPVLNGQIESPSERAQYLAQKAQQPGGGHWGAAPAAPSQPPAYGQLAQVTEAGRMAQRLAQQPAPAGYPPAAAPQPAGPPAGYPAAPPAAAPPAAAPPQWGQPAPDGWGAY